MENKNHKNRLPKQPKQTYLQAILFDKKIWTFENANNWFFEHGFTMPKNKLVHETQKYYRFRIKHPNYKKFEYRIKNLGHGIDAIIGIEI